MDDSLTVAIIHCAQYLSELDPSILFLHAPVRHEIIVELATINVFHYKKQSVLCLNDLKKLDDIWMIQHLHDSDFTMNLGEFLLIKRRLINDLNRNLHLESNGYLLTSELMLC